MRFLFFILLLFFSTAVFPQDCSQASTAFIPVADLGNQMFNGFRGGKYPGSNAIPQKHFLQGEKESEKITALDKNGMTDSTGSIGFLVLGYSTAAMTGRYFRYITQQEKINPAVKILIGAQGGLDINSMLEQGGKYYLTIDSILEKENMSNLQVQVIWLSSGDIHSFSEPFPQQCETQVEKYRTALAILKNKFPNLHVVFLSDRPYAGYIGTEGPQDLKEPSGYYNSWTIKWLIEKQITLEKGFTYDDLPFIDWGPTLWTNGEKGNSSGYRWNCDDAGKGGIHASAKGRAKEACKLYLFFTSHPYCTKWFYASVGK